MILDYSVLMSVYYKEKPEWLRMSIDSIVKQTVQPKEIVIIKDGKLTSTLDEVINSFVKDYPGLFSIYELSENVGLGKALAYGIKKCKYELIVRMDSDDYSVKNRCEKLLKKFNEDTSLDIVGSWENEFEYEINNIQSVHKVPEKSNEIFNFMKRRCAILHPTVLYKRQSVLKAGNYRNVILYEDYDLFLRMVIEHKMKVYNIQEPLYYIRINDNFFRRRGGVSYMKTAVSFKGEQYKNGHLSLKDFIISAGGQAVVCMLPNSLRKLFYMKFLR